jgi:hypothetical protein
VTILSSSRKEDWIRSRAKPLAGRCCMKCDACIRQTKINPRFGELQTARVSRRKTHDLLFSLISRTRKIKALLSWPSVLHFCQSIGFHVTVANMLFSVALFACFLNAVHGAVFPAPTPAARYEKRQQAYIGAATIWSPTTIGSTLTCMFGHHNRYRECSTLIRL